MKSFLVLTDGYHEDIIISNNDEDFFMRDFVLMLAKPHTEEYAIAEFDMEYNWENSAVPEEVLEIAEDFFSHGGLYRPCSEYEFNSMWHFANKLMEE